METQVFININKFLLTILMASLEPKKTIEVEPKEENRKLPRRKLKVQRR